MPPRSLLAFAVLVAPAAAGCGGGCVYTPYRDVAFRSDALGTDDRAVLKVGTASRADVFARFGEKPSYRTVHDRAVGYLFGTTVGRYRGLLMGPCAPYIGESARGIPDHVWLEFDEAGKLVRYERNREGSKARFPDREWEAFIRTVPDQRRPGDVLLPVSY